MRLPALISNMPQQDRSVAAQIQKAKVQTDQVWQLTVARSAEYAAALGINENHIETLDELGGVIVVSVAEGEIFLVAKRTCGDTWRTLIQPRVSQGNFATISIGGGTTYCVVLDPACHKAVMDAIRADRVSLIKERVWP